VFSKELLEVLACPACKADLALEQDRWLVCAQCGRRYLIQENGIAVLLVSEGDKSRASQSPDFVI
jgi:uncharacterized protein YbaR (Trm112 family)